MLSNRYRNIKNKKSKKQKPRAVFRPSGVRFILLCGLLHGLFQRLLYIGEDVPDILDADGEADQVGADAGLLELAVGELAVRRAGGVQHAGAQIRHMRDNRGELQTVHEFRRRLAAALDAEGNDAAGAVRHILLRERIIRAALKAGVVDPRDALVRLEEFRNRQRV